MAREHQIPEMAVMPREMATISGKSTESCPACGSSTLEVFADLGEIPIYCGVHFATREEALASPAGKAVLGFCGECAYVRNMAFDPDLLTYDTSMDMDLLHSPLFRAFAEDLVKQVAARHPMRQVIDLGCAGGEFLRDLCALTGATGTGFDIASFFPSRSEPLPPFDFVVSRHLLEHVVDPFAFLADLRAQAGPDVRGYIEVPDATYDLAGAGWQVIYPHVSYFGAHSLHRMIERSGWGIDESGSFFSGMLRYAYIGPSTSVSPESPQPLLDSIAGFAARNAAERDRWQSTVSTLASSGRRPVLWGAGSRGVQFLQLADPGRELAAVVDVNPRKWNRYLPVTGHQVLEPSHVASVQPSTVIITNPVYRDEIAASLHSYGVDAEILIA